MLYEYYSKDEFGITDSPTEYRKRETHNFSYFNAVSARFATIRLQDSVKQWEDCVVACDKTS